jgi:hypothetical protein
MKKYKEIKGCKEGEANTITKEHFCNLYCEFCKYVKCNLKVGELEQHTEQYLDD